MPGPVSGALGKYLKNESSRRKTRYQASAMPTSRSSSSEEPELDVKVYGRPADIDTYFNKAQIIGFAWLYTTR